MRSVKCDNLSSMKQLLPFLLVQRFFMTSLFIFNLVFFVATRSSQVANRQRSDRFAGSRLAWQTPGLWKAWEHTSALTMHQKRQVFTNTSHNKCVVMESTTPNPDTPELLHNLTLRAYMKLRVFFLAIAHSQSWMTIPCWSPGCTPCANRSQ